MTGKSKKSVFIGALGLLCCFWAAHCQENYTLWAHHAAITLNTSFTGANVYNDVHNFPVLIRLDPSNFPAFSQLNYSGTKPIDIRFSKSSDITKHFPYQIEYWSPTKDTLAIWVLVDTISGGNDQQTITMHYGMTGVYDSSNGAKVFDVANGYLGVWHLGDTADATANGYSATNTTGLPKDTIGMIGHGRYFANQAYLQMGTTASKISSAVMPFGGPWTLSAWVILDPSATAQLAVAGAGDAGYQIQRQTGGGGEYSMTDYGPGGTGTTGGYMEAFASSSVSSLGTWHHLVAVRDNSVGTSPYYAESLYVDGYLAGGSVGINQHTEARNKAPFCIAKQGEAMGHFLTGIVDEVEMSSVARSSDWAALSFQNQQAAQTLVTIAIPTAPVPVLSSPTNGASGQQLSLTLSWNSVIPLAGTASYSIQVSTASDFSSTVLSLTGLTSTSAGISSLSYYATYLWHVNATDGSGTSKWATAWSFSTIQLAPPAPILSSPTNGAPGQPVSLTLAWGTSSGATSYAVQVSTVSTFANTVFSQTGAGVTAIVTGLASGGVTYYWQVSAISSTGASWSAIWSFSTLIPSSVGGQILHSTDAYEFSLKQGMIVYSLPKAGEVELSICDMLGRTALSSIRMQNAGHYTVDLKSSSLAAGKYTVRFKAGNLEKNAIMMLTR